MTQEMPPGLRFLDGGGEMGARMRAFDGPRRPWVRRPAGRTVAVPRPRVLMIARRILPGCEAEVTAVSSGAEALIALHLAKPINQAELIQV